MGGATQIGSKRAFLIKLKNGLTSSRVLTTFAVHAGLIVLALTRPYFHVDGWAAGPCELKTPQRDRDFSKTTRFSGQLALPAGPSSRR